MRRAKSLAALVLALALGLSACGERPPAPTPEPTPTPTLPSPTATETAGTAEFVLPWYSEESTHPLAGSNQTNLNLAPLIYEGLFVLDEVFVPHNLLASGQTVSEDGLTWSITLRGDVAFSDGSPLTGREVAKSLQTAMTSPLYSARLSGIKAVRAEGDGGVSITLHTPNGGLPALLDVPIVKEEGSAVLGTGPYIMAGEGESTLLRKNSGWWQSGVLPVEEIRLYPVWAADTLTHAFDTREISLATADLTGINALGFSGNYEVWDYPTSIMLYVGYNTASGPCADQALRQTLSRAFDRQQVARSLLSGHATAAALPFSPVTDCYDTALAATLDYTSQAVDEALTGMGWAFQDGVRYKNREKLALSLLVNTDNTYKIAVAEQLAADLTRAGVAVELRKLTWEEYNAALAAGDFDLYLGQVKLTGDFDLSPLITVGGALNFGGYADPESDVLLDEFRAANDAVRPAAASNLSRRLAETAPFAVLCFKNWSVLTHWGKVGGVNPTQQNLFYEFSGWKMP